MRLDGKKMTPDAIRATGVVLRVLFRRHPLGQPAFEARAFDVVTGREVGHLSTASIKLIDDGIKIAGYEPFVIKPQLWWCVPLTPAQLTELSLAPGSEDPLGAAITKKLTFN